MSYRTILAIFFNAVLLAICFCPSSDKITAPRVELVVESANSVAAVDSIILLSSGDAMDGRLLVCREWVAPRDADAAAAPAAVWVEALTKLPAPPASDHSLPELVEELLHGPAISIQRRQDLIELGF
jgi:hypothetical protein